MKKQLIAAVMGKNQAKAKQERELNSFERSMQANGFHPRVISRVQEKFIFPDPNLLRADELQDAYQIFLSIERYTYLVATYFRMVKGIAMKILSIFDWNISITIISFVWIGCRR